MTEFIKFPSTGQFRDAIKQIQQSSGFHSLEVPKVRFTGTVKLHGTNAGIVIARDGSWHVQSRERILSVESDNAGFAAWAHGNKAFLDRYAGYMAHALFDEETHCVVYGEWCGGNIQKGVGLNQLEKMFVVFSIGFVKPNPTPQPGSEHIISWGCVKDWFNDLVTYGAPANLYNSNMFKTYEVEVDFNSPTLIQNDLVNLTLEVEKDCPVARHFLPDYEGELVGEGIVWIPSEGQEFPEPLMNVLNGLKFKTKGEKHTVSTVKAIAPIDIEKVKSTDAFIEGACNQNRLEQGLKKLEEMGLPLDNTSIGAYIKWVVGDILREEIETMTASGIEPKDVNSKIAVKAKKFLLSHF